MKSQWLEMLANFLQLESMESTQQCSLLLETPEGCQLQHTLCSSCVDRALVVCSECCHLVFLLPSMCTNFEFFCQVLLVFLCFEVF